MTKLETSKLPQQDDEELEERAKELYFAIYVPWQQIAS